MELVAGRAIRGLEKHRKRLGTWLTPQVVGRSEEERLVVQYRTCRLAHALLEIVAERLLGHDATIEPRYFAVAPHVHRERHEVLARFLHDAALGKIGRHELLAVG